MICAEDATPVRVAQTSPAAFAALYERYYTLVLSVIRCRISDPIVAEDLTAQTFIHAWQAFARYEERGKPFSSWLIRIAQNEVISHARRRYPPTLTPEEAERALIDDASLEDLVMQRERAAWLRRQLHGLPASQRQVVWLRFGEERSYREIGVTLHRSEGAAKVLLHRALKSLRLQARESSGERSGIW